jgi:hypothetical protein
MNGSSEGDWLLGVRGNALDTPAEHREQRASYYLMHRLIQE